MKIDARGLSCPMPVVMVQREIERSKPQELVVLVDARVAVENITRFASHKNYEVSVSEADGEYTLILKREVPGSTE